jgi:phosphoserine phosphatase RsbU/P
MTKMSDADRLPIDISADPNFAERLDLFRSAATATVSEILRQCPQQNLKEGETFLEPGQPNHHIYFLLSGRLDIRLKSPQSPIADTIEIGDCIGEMSIIDGEPTSAYVVARVDSCVLLVHESVFWSKIATESEAVRNLSRVLAERMRKRNEATLRALEKEIRLEQLQKELGAAYEIQSGMLPPGPQLVRDVDNIDVWAKMSVVKSVGGDFYDAFRINEDKVCIAIGDVSGKGMPAALFMVRTMTLLRTELNSTDEFGGLMSKFNQALCDTNIAHMFASLIVLRLCTKTGHLECINAGHSPFLFSSGGGEFREIDQDRGLIAGVIRDSVYHVEKMQLNAGDRILMYTDGVTEARNAEKKFFGLSRLLLIANQNQVSNTQNLVKLVFDKVEEFTGPIPASDDTTLVALQFGRARA